MMALTPDYRLLQSVEVGLDWDRRLLRKIHAQSFAPDACTCPLCSEVTQ